MITLNEDLFEDLEVDSTDNILAAPKDSKDTYIAEHLMNLIKDEYEAIQGYNKFLDNIGTHEEMKSTIEDIAMEEMKHVGQLQALLKTISPNVEAVETGTKEAEEMLDKEVEVDAPIDESLTEKYKVKTNDLDKVVSRLIDYYLDSDELLSDLIKALDPQIAAKALQQVCNNNSIDLTKYAYAICVDPQGDDRHYCGDTNWQELPIWYEDLNDPDVLFFDTKEEAEDFIDHNPNAWCDYVEQGDYDESDLALEMKVIKVDTNDVDWDNDPIDESLNESLSKSDKQVVLDWAKDDFENGQVMDPDDYSEFAKICEESGIKSSKELFDLYFEEIDNLRDEEEVEDESLDVDDNGYKFEVVKSTYKNNNLPFLALAIKDAEDKDEIGQFWSDITINLDGLEVVNKDLGPVIALDNDFDQFAPADLKEKVLNTLTTNEIITTIPSGFVDFKVYKLKDNILDSIRTIEDFEYEIENQEKE